MPTESPGQYAFEHAAVAIFVQDISRVRSRLARLASAKDFDVREYLALHPEFLAEAISSIDLLDVNQASVRLFEAASKDQLIGTLDKVLREATPAAVAESIVAVYEGRTQVEVESTALTVKGRRLHLLVKIYVPPPEAPGAPSIISLIDITDRKEAEERERRSANLLRRIIDSSPDSVFVKDTSLRMVLCNAALAHSIGKEPEALSGKTDLENGWSADLVKGDPDRGTAGWEAADLAALSGQTVRVNDEIPDVDGNLRHYDTIKAPLRTEEGAIMGLIGVGRDVTEQRRLEKELAREHSLFALLMDHLPSQIYFKDRDSRYLRNSRSHARALGASDPADVVGRTDADFFDPESARRFREDELRIMSTGAPIVDAEEMQAYPDRPDTWVITTKMPFREQGGEIAGTFGISRDVTQRRLLQEKNRQLAQLVEASDDAIVGIGMDRRITVWNQGAERIYGYTAEEMIGNPTTPLIPEELEGEALMMREKLARGERIEHFETTRRRKDRSPITVSLTLSAIRDETGAMVGIASVARDVTAQKAFQAQAARVQRLESMVTLAAGVAHRFNNVNTAVKGYLGILLREKDLPDRLRRFILAADTAVSRGVDITDSLLLMTEPVGDPRATVRLDQVARSVLEALGERISAEGAQLMVDLADPPPCRGEEPRLRFAVTTLVINALDALVGRPRRVVTVKTGTVPEGAFLEVQDTGCGIREADMAKVFTPFFSTKGEWAAAGSPQAHLRGLGLNLSISHSAVSDYGGRIDVHSREEEGSVFRILLPVAVKGVAGTETS